MAFEVTPSRLISWTSSSKSDQLDRKRTVVSHVFNAQAEIFLGYHKKCNLSLHDKLFQMMKEYYYYRVTASLLELINDDFMKKYAWDYSLQFMSETQGVFSVALLPTRHLLLTVDKITSEKLGLPCVKYGCEYRIDINLNNGLSDRVKWCLHSDRVNNISVLLCCTKNGECVDVDFSKDCAFTKHSLDFTVYNWDTLNIPTLSSTYSTDQLTETLDFIGLVSMREKCTVLGTLRVDSTTDYCSKFSLSLPTTIGKGISVRWVGFLPSDLLLHCLNYCNDLNENIDDNFVSLIVHGIQDSPISYINKDKYYKHEYSESGENHYVYIINKEICWQYLALGPSDECQ